MSNLLENTEQGRQVFYTLHSKVADGSIVPIEVGIALWAINAVRACSKNWAKSANAFEMLIYNEARQPRYRYIKNILESSTKVISDEYDAMSTDQEYRAYQDLFDGRKHSYAVENIISEARCFIYCRLMGIPYGDKDENGVVEYPNNAPCLNYVIVQKDLYAFLNNFIYKNKKSMERQTYLQLQDWENAQIVVDKALERAIFEYENGITNSLDIDNMSDIKIEFWTKLYSSLSPMQQKVFRLGALRTSQRAISADLGISQQMVAKYIKIIRAMAIDIARSNNAYLIALPYRWRKIAKVA